MSKEKKDEKGRFTREESGFRNWITKDGEYPPEKDRYHLYVSTPSPGPTEL